MMRLLEQEENISFELGEAVFLLLLLVIYCNSAIPYRRRDIHVIYMHADIAHTFTPTTSIDPSIESHTRMHMQQLVRLARFKCAQMWVFVPQVIFRERPLHTSLYTEYLNFRLPIQ
jgi:hypothetical protein